MSSSIKVAVRCRPLNSRELARGAKGLIRMNGNQTVLEPPDSTDADPGNAKVHSTRSHAFTFDHSYWSAGDRDEPDYASQQTLFDDLGKDLLTHAFEGYNTCIFAYGQTGSGKSYSMMGYGSDRGIIPLTCSALFDRITEYTSDTLSFTVEVSFIEIYNERVRDLLNPKNKGNLKVREHPSLGPYVEDLSKLGVESYVDMERLMDEGNKARTVAATQMNETSSRSHSVFTVLLTQKKLDLETKMVGEKVSRISLVDLAGSERANSTGATGARLKEGANINKSLTTLGKVIAALAKESTKSDTPKGKKKPAAEFVPYRDSVLTWLLKDSLGGNSKTAMIAAISPADYEETLSTLRYADQAKKIQNKAVVNEDANAKLVRELKEELAMLRARVSGAGAEAVYDPSVPPEKQIVQYKTKTGELKTVTKAELQEQLEQSEKLMADVNQTWEEKMQKTVVIQKEREQALEELGIVIEKGNVGVHTPKKMPHLVNLCEDPLMSECLLYQIKPGRTTVGNTDSKESLDIRLSGDNVLSSHCFFQSAQDGSVSLHAEPGSMTMVNGLRIGSDKPKELKSGYRIILGDVHVFRFNHPEQVRKSRDSKVLGPSGLRHERISSHGIPLDDSVATSGTSSPVPQPERPPSPTASNVDWSYARREAVVARLNGTNVDLDALEDAELSGLFNDLMKVRSNRRHGTSMGRPESRDSYLDSIDEDDDDANTTSESASRPFSGHTWGTDDTSLDSTMNFGNISTVEMEERLQETREEMQKELDSQREEYEAKLQTLVETANSAITSTQEKVKMETQLQNIQYEMQIQLDEQKKAYEEKVKRLAQRAARRSGTAFSDWDDADVELAQRVIRKWRKLRSVSMAQAVLTHAVLLKEANVVSREFGKKVTYQFTIVDDIGAPTSALEGISALAELEDVSDPPPHKLAQPFVAVKVIDARSSSIYVWSIERLQAKVQQMQRLYSLLDKPSYSKHFSLEDPFYNSAPPRYSFIGHAKCPLAPLRRRLLMMSTLRILSPYTGEQVASCVVRMKPIGITSGPVDETLTLSKELAAGDQCSFELNIDSVQGIDSTDFKSIHCQIRLSSIIGTGTPAEEDVYASPIASANDADGIRLRLRKTITLSMSAATVAHWRSGRAVIEFYGDCNLAYLYKCEKWDETKEEKGPIRPWHLSRADSDLPADTTGRTRETELLINQTYDVKAMISVQELSNAGVYKPVELMSTGLLDPGYFQCRQGIQRRLGITLSHGCGRQWLWTAVQNIKMGNIRLLDPKGHLTDSRKTATLSLSPVNGKADPQYNDSGTTYVDLVAGWDSSAHNSAFLNRTTAAGHRVIVELSWELQVEGCPNPISFSVDIGLAMQERAVKGTSSIFGFFSTPKAATQTVFSFQVTLTPAATNKASELWRFNTGATFVRGEELLQRWKPRGTSLIEDYYRSRHVQDDLCDIVTAQAVLASIPARRLIHADIGQHQEFRLSKTLSLWRKRWGPSHSIKLSQDPTWEDLKSASNTPMSPLMSPDPSSSSSNGGYTAEQEALGLTSPSASLSRKQKKSKPKRRKQRTMKATVKPIYKAETVAKKGPLWLLQNTTNAEGANTQEWTKLYAVLRRPYLSLYTSATEERELPNVINISTVRVDHSQELDSVLNRAHAFGIYTPVAALFMAASTYPEMLAWTDLIDPTWRRMQ